MAEKAWQARVVPLAQRRVPRRSRPASNWARARAAMRRRCSAGSRASWSPRTAAPDSRAGSAAARRPGAWRSPGHARRVAGCAGRCARRARGAVAVSRRGEATSPSLGEVVLDRRPHGRVGGQRVGVEAGRHRSQPEPGPAHEDARPHRGRPVPRARSSACVAEVGHAERLVGIDEVEPVVDDPPPLLGRRLRRADVEAAVDLPRVGRDRSRPGVRPRSGARRARSRGRSCRSPSGRR